VLAALAIITATSWGAERPFLAAPQYIAPPDAEHAVTNRAFQGIPSMVLSTGEWVLPVSTWAATDRSARMLVSTNQGETWTVRGGCNVPRNVRSFDEHMFIERRDGSLWLLVRTKYGIGETAPPAKGSITREADGGARGTIDYPVGPE